MDINHLSDVLVNVFLFCGLSFCWQFPLLCKNFLAWCSPTYLFFLLFPLPGEIVYLIKYCYKQCLKFCCICFLLGFLCFMGLIFKSLVHFEFIHVCGVKRVLVSFFSTYLSSFPNTTCWINYLQPSVCACFVYWILIDY